MKLTIHQIKFFQPVEIPTGETSAEIRTYATEKEHTIDMCEGGLIRITHNRTGAYRWSSLMNMASMKATEHGTDTKATPSAAKTGKQKEIKD